jgi:hypothetical protein
VLGVRAACRWHAQKDLLDKNITSALAVDREFVYIVGCPWTPLGCPWAPFGCPWALLRCLLGSFSVPLGCFGVPLGSFGVPLGSFGVPLGSFWVPGCSLGGPSDFSEFGHRFPSKCCSSTTQGDKIRPPGICPTSPTSPTSPARHRKRCQELPPQPHDVSLTNSLKLGISINTSTH